MLISVLRKRIKNPSTWVRQLKMAAHNG